MKTFLKLPERASKPRTQGLSILLDNGVPTNLFRDVVTSSPNLIDFVKFGWCTALVTADLSAKIQALRDAGIGFFFGGTLFEKAYVQRKLEDYMAFLRSHACEWVEISNGTITLSNSDKAKQIEAFSRHFKVLSEVGYKDAQRSLDMSPARWVEYMKQDLAAGAVHVIAEARESGKSGICRADGEVRYGLITEILDSDIPRDRLVFEAPNKELQTFFIKKIGSNVNLANIAFSDVIGLETLRLGLRSDTLMLFEESN